MSSSSSLTSDFGSDADLWPLNAASRKKITDRISSNLATLSSFADKTVQVDDSVAYTHAIKIETEAFNLAEEKFKAGEMKGSELVKWYARHAGDAMVALVKSKELLRGAEKVGEEGAKAQLVEEIFDISGGKREFLDKEKAEALLQPLLSSENGKVKKICFSGKSFTESAAPVAAAAISNLKATLRDADLSDIIAGRPEQEALSVLRIVSDAVSQCQLESLDLSNNAFGEKGVRACAAALTSQTGLKKLVLCNNGISAEAAAAILELLPNPAALQTLHFFNNMSGDEGAVTLASLVAKAPLLEDFRFSSTRVQTDGGIALANALATGSNLVRLDMRDNMFGEEGAEAIAEIFTRHPNIRDVVLGDTGLGNEGVAAVVESLAKHGKNLEVLDLAGNDVSVAGAKSIAACLPSWPKLKKLILSDNELGDKGAAILAAAIAKHSRNLEELDLATNEISRVGAVAAARAIANIAGFKLLNVNGNQISEAGIDALKQALASGSAGEGVLGLLDENDEEGEGEDEDEEGDEIDEELRNVLESLSVNK